MPDNPVLPFIRGDGTGPDIWASAVRVLDSAVEKAYGGAKKIAWMEVSAGEASFKKYNNWLPDDTVEAFKEFLVGIKGPLTTPVGGGIRSLNVALRQLLDLYVCLRPVRYFAGVPSLDTGFTPMPLVAGKRIFLTPISPWRKSMTFFASGVPACHSTPA